MSIQQIGGLTIRNTSKLITPDTKVCAMVYGRPKMGKTTFGSTLDRMTKKYFGKPTLFIAVEAGEGGGTMSIQDAGVDFVCPADYNEMKKVIAALQTDTYYGGVVVDSATEYVKRYLQPYALRFPSRERTQQRQAGVPERGDYQTMGESLRIDFNQLINLTTNPDLNVRKHLVVTALYREHTTDAGVVDRICPDLPGAMAENATAMFQTVGQVRIKAKVEKDPRTQQPMRVTQRMFITAGDGVAVLGDRTKLLPEECELDWELLYEKYWLPKFEQQKAAA